MSGGQQEGARQELYYLFDRPAFSPPYLLDSVNVLSSELGLVELGRPEGRVLLQGQQLGGDGAGNEGLVVGALGDGGVDTDGGSGVSGVGLQRELGQVLVPQPRPVLLELGRGGQAGDQGVLLGALRLGRGLQAGLAALAAGGVALAGEPGLAALAPSLLLGAGVAAGVGLLVGAGLGVVKGGKGEGGKFANS